MDGLGQHDREEGKSSRAAESTPKRPAQPPGTQVADGGDEVPARREEPRQQARNAGRTALRARPVAEVPDHLEAEHPHDLLAAPPAAAGVHFAAHRLGVEVRRLFAGERDEADCSTVRDGLEQPRHFDQNRDSRSVIVGSGRLGHGVVVGAEQYDLLGPRFSGSLDDEIRRGRIIERIRFVRDVIAECGELAFYELERRTDRFGTAEVPRADQSGEAIDVRVEAVR